MNKHEEAINEKLTSIKGILSYQLNDRIWKPNASCWPFFLTSSAQYLTRAELFSFFVPSRCIAVITDYSFFALALVGGVYQPFFCPKNTHAVKILRGSKAGDELLEGKSIALNGLLSNVREFGLAAEPISGLEIRGDGSPIPCRIILEGGYHYLIGGRNTSGNTINLSAMINGYCFRNEPIFSTIQSLL